MTIIRLYIKIGENDWNHKIANTLLMFFYKKLVLIPATTEATTSPT